MYPKVKDSAAKSQPWYKYSMVWMVILLPTIVILASSVTIYIAFQNSPEIITLTNE